MRLEVMLNYCKTVQVMQNLGLNRTRHNVAKNVKFVTRRTVYRHIEILCKIGLLSMRNRSDGKTSVLLTQEGYDFLQTWGDTIL